MRFLFRLIPLVLGLVTLGTFAFALIAPRLVLWSGAIGLILVAYGFFELFGRRVRGRDFWCTLPLALILFASSFGFFLLLEGWLAGTLVAILTGVLMTMFAEYLYRWFYEMKHLPSYALGVMTSFLEVFLIFFVASDLIGLRIFLRVPVGVLVAGFAVLAFLIYTLARAPRGASRSVLGPALMMGLLCGEFFWALLFLPTSFMVGGALLAILWYVVTGIVRVEESGLAIRRPVRRYALLAGVLSVLIVASARWV